MLAAFHQAEVPTLCTPPEVGHATQVNYNENNIDQQTVPVLTHILNVPR